MKWLKTDSARARLAALGLVLVAVPAWSNPAQAGPIDDANRRLTDLEERARALTSQFREQNAVDPNAADRRLVEAQTYHELKNYEVAATLCLDIIDKYPNSRVYDDALVLLGDSLYKNNDVLSARRYFEMARQKKNGSRNEQNALQRLIEIALRTGDYENVEEYLTRLSQIPPAQLEPSVPYVRGKYMFFRDRPDEAIAAFAQVNQQNPYYLQARYFTATVQVKKGDLASAAQTFEEVLRVQPRNEADREVQDLARLAVGRIFYDRGQFDRARDMYASVPRQSRHFGDAMYESAWNSIKAKDFKAAYRALDLMLLQNPDSPQAPELRLLMGNLNLRMNNFFVASESFGKTRDEFEPLYRQLLAVNDRTKNDPQYFASLIGKGLEKFDIALFIPTDAVKYVKSEPDVARMLVLADDVGELQRGIKESEQLIVNLEKAVNGAGKVGIFNDLGTARVRSTEILNQTVDVRRKFIDQANKLAVAHLSPEDRGALGAIEAERQRLDQQLKDLPLTEEALRKRSQDLRGNLQKLDAQASESNVLIQSLEAELVAIEQYYIRSRADQKIRPEELKQPVSDLRSEIDALRLNLERVRNEIADAAREAGTAGTAAAGERNAAVRLGELMKQEHAIFARARTRMSGDEAGQFDRISNVLGRADGIQNQLAGFDQRLETIAEQRLVSIRQSIETEKGQLQQANQKLTAVLGESQSVGGGLAQVVLGKATERFYDLTVQSDVGLVDVSWGLKDSKTSTMSKLINQQKLEMKSVEDDFRSLLEEEK